MSSPPTTTPVVTPATTAVTTPATSDHQHEQDKNDAPDNMPNQPTNDFYKDTFFNPVWMSGPNVFSFAKDGTIVKPEKYAKEPYPGYQVDGRRLRFPNTATRKDPKPWKNVAITEQDDEEYAAFLERVRIGAIGEWRGNPPYGHGQNAMPGGAYMHGHPVIGAPGVGQGYLPYPHAQNVMFQAPYAPGPYPMDGAPCVEQGYAYMQPPVLMPENQSGFTYYSTQPPKPHQ